MLLVDTMSCLPCPSSTATIELDVRIDYHVFTASKIATAEGRNSPGPSSLCCLSLYIGWLARDKKTCASYCQGILGSNTLSTDNDLLMKGKCMIIPESNQQRTLIYLHVRHKGTTEMQCMFYSVLAQSLLLI